MHIKIIDSKEKYDNTGTCTKVVQYNEHEDKERFAAGLSPEPFFDGCGVVDAATVTEKIDNNRAKLSRDEDKFFVVIVSPSAEEIALMGKTEAEQAAAFQRYIREEVIPQYADGFGRKISTSDGQRDMNGDDIMFFGKIHHNRDTTKESDGNMHAHLIISRKSLDGLLKLSPLANQRQNTGSFRGGFCRDNFYEACESRFDKLFHYSRRPLEKTYRYLTTMKNGEMSDRVFLQERVIYQRAERKRNDAILREYFASLQDNQEKAVVEKEKSVAEVGISLSLGLINDEPQQVPQYVPSDEERKKKKQKKKGIRPRYW
jgi:hypothetical protein